MIDTHAVARSLTDAEFTPAQVEAVTAAVRMAAERGDHVTAERFEAGLAALAARIYRAMLIQAGAIVGSLVGIAGLVLAAARLMGGG